MIDPLSIHTEDLTLHTAGVEIPVRSTGDRLLLDVPTVRDGLRLLRANGTGAASWVPTRALVEADLTVEVRVRDRPVLMFGAGANPGVVSRVTGTWPAEVRPLGVAGALFDGGRSLRGAGRRLLRR